MPGSFQGIPPHLDLADHAILQDRGLEEARFLRMRPGVRRRRWGAVACATVSHQRSAFASARER